VAWYDIEPCFIQHVVNAYEHAGRIVLEAVRYPDFLRFDDERGAFAPNPLGTLWRFTIDTVTGATTETALDDRAIELPRIDERRTGRRHRYLYAVEQPSDTEMRGLVKYDGRDGGCRHVPIPPGDQNSEPVFVPRSAATSADDDGWVITCVYRHQTHTTDVVVLDACDLDPVATVHLPRPVPAGFHGAWLPAEQR
jgi:carotenoid cleavage dioxygenase